MRGTGCFIFLKLQLRAGVSLLLVALHYNDVAQPQQ